MHKKIFLSILIIFLLSLSIQSCKVDQSSQSSFSTMPAPQPGKAVVYGRALNISTKKPVSGSLYLSKDMTMNLEQDIPPTISFSFQNDPNAKFDPDTGDFIFENIDPADNYVLVLHEGPSNVIIVTEKSSQSPLYVQVDSGDVLNLGTIYIQE